MEIKAPTLVLFLAAAGAGAWAAFGSSSSTSSAASTTAAQPTQPAETEEQEQELPPDHPTLPTPEPEPAAIAWTPPSAWQVAQNPNTMRIATYRAGEAEIIVARAGGSVEQNIDRWLGQFTGASPPSRSEATVAGFHTDFVEVSGTYEGGMSMNDPSPKPEPGWTLRGAIVETPGSSYFFKMIGPSASVTAARPAFDAMIRGITKATQ